MEKTNNKSFMQTLKDTLTDYIRHPKKLLPTIVLTVIWIAFSLMSTLGVNLLFLRFLYAVTYSNGGMFGGFFGAVGGIFGKAVFAAIVNVLVLSICEKKNPFNGLKAGLKSTVGGGIKAVSPFLIGGGTGILLYWFFNMTSSTQNCAVSVACVLAGLRALSSKNSILISGIFWLLGKITKGKTPSKTTASRILAGLTAGFAVSFPITFFRLPVLIVILGALLVAAGIIILLAMNKKTVAVVLLVLLSLPLFGTVVYAEENSFTMRVSSFYADFYTQQGQHYTSWDDWMYYGFYKAGEITVTKDSDGNYTFTVPGYDYSFTNGDKSYSVSIPSITFKGADFTYSTNSGNYYTEFNAQLDDIVTVNYTLHYNESNKDYITYYQLKSFVLPLWFNKSGINGNVIDVHSNDVKCTSRSYGENVEDPDTYTSWSDYSGLFSQGFTVTGYQISGSETAEDENVEYKPYRGILTYTNGRINENGQPFPDLMDFDGDGEMTWLDVAIQKELSHDPDYLDRPESKAAGVLIGVLTSIFGAAAGATAAAIGGAAGGAAAGVLGGVEGLAENIEIPTAEDDLGPHIARDSDGDLNVTDPATGEKRLYKANGDGTYTNPLTGATYTEAELKASLESRAENAGTIRQDEKKRDEAISAQRAKSGEMSELSKETAEKFDKMKESEKQEDYIVKLENKYHTDGKELKKKVMQKQIDAEVESNQHMADEKYYEAWQKTAESTEKAADVAIDVLSEVTGEPGKAVKDAYTFTKATMARGSEAFAEGKSVAKGLVHGAIEGTVGVVQNRADSPTEKLAANVGGDVFKVALDSTVKGEKIDISEVTEAAASAAINTGIDVGADLAGDVVKGVADLGDNAVANVFKTEITSESAADAVKTFIADETKDMAEKTFEIPEKKDD